MAYTQRFHPGLAEDLKSLDRGIRKRVLKKMDEIAEKPELGKALGNRDNLDLSGYRKVYMDSKRIRIVYGVEEEEVVVYFVAVGARSDMEVYKEAFRRIREA